MDSIRHEVNKLKIHKYWIRKKKYNINQEINIDWELFARSRMLLSKSRQIWMSKWLSGFCGVGRRLFLQSYQSHSNCPRCNLTNEDTSHVIQCKDVGATLLWEEEINSLQKWMENHGGDPGLTNTICGSLKSWRNHRPLPSVNTSEYLINEAIYKQDSIGWRSFIDGFIVKEWRDIQRNFMERNDSQRSPMLWMTKFQRRIWEIPWKLWGHRNQILHGDGSLVHVQEKRNVDFAILREWDIGNHNVDARFHNLFSGSLQDRLNDSNEAKRLWLASVWGAKNIADDADEGRDFRESTSLMFFDKWRARYRN